MWILVEDADKHSFPPLSRSQRNQRKSEAFRDKPAANTHGVFQGIAHTRLWAKRPAFNTVIIGAVFAFHWRGDKLNSPLRSVDCRGIGYASAPAFFWQKSIKPMGSSGTRYATHIGAFRGMPCRNTLYSIRHFSAPELRSISHGNLGNYTLPNLVSDSGESESMLPGRGPFPPRLFFAQNRPTRRLKLSTKT